MESSMQINFPDAITDIDLQITWHSPSSRTKCKKQTVTSASDHIIFTSDVLQMKN